MIRRLLSHMTPPSHCGQPMSWDVFRASWLCHCGVAK
jgi:hypothetical protein